MHNFRKKSREILAEIDNDRANYLENALHEAYEQGAAEVRTKVLLEFLDADGKCLYSFGYTTQDDPSYKDEINMTRLASCTRLRLTSR